MNRQTHYRLIDRIILTNEKDRDAYWIVEVVEDPVTGLARVLQAWGSNHHRPSLGRTVSDMQKNQLLRDGAHVDTAIRLARSAANKKMKDGRYGPSPIYARQAASQYQDKTMIAGLSLRESSPPSKEPPQTVPVTIPATIPAFF